MDETVIPLPVNSAPVTRPAYDPNNLDPLDEEDRKHDDATTDIDWDEIIASTEDDWRAGRFCFDSEQYATDEEAEAALEQWFNSKLEKVIRDEAAAAQDDAARR